MKILFLGSSLFSRIVLDKMLKAGLDVVAVVTQPARPSGRGHKLTPTEVQVYAEECGLPIYAFEKLNQHMEEIRNIDYDYAITASFGQILGQEFLAHRPCLNVHPSLLPKYRGSTPIQTALLNGDNVTGVTIMKVVREVDAGDILLQREDKITQNDDFESLTIRLAEIGGDMTVNAFKLIEAGLANFTPQEHDKATFVKMLSKEDGHLDFNDRAENLVNRVRAFGGNPSCYFMFGEDKIKVVKVKDVSDEFSGKPNELISFKKRFIIGAQNGAVEILACSAPSGKVMQAKDFLNGYRVEGKTIQC